MLKVFLCVCSYNPYDGPNENPEAELPLVAGKYLYVYGNMDDDGFYEGEDDAAPLTQDEDSYFCSVIRSLFFCFLQNTVHLI